jgi:hypothetical protein
MFQKNLVEKIKTQFTFNNFFPENRAIYEMMVQNILKPGRPPMTI